VKELLRSHSLSYVQGLQIALEAQGIGTALFDQQTVGFIGFAGRVRLVVQRDADYERALQVIRELEASTPPQQPVPGWKLQRVGCVTAVLGVAFLGVGGAMVSDLAIGSQFPPVVAYGVVGVAIVMTVAGLALILFGPRLGRRGPRA
jgi:hypothetical protein